MSAAPGVVCHGLNIGFGYVKYVVIEADGQEAAPITFPALVAPAGPAVAGSIAHTTKVVYGGRTWLVGESALASPQPLTRLDHQRLHDPILIPVLVTEALRRARRRAGELPGACVTGLPATWARVRVHCTALGARLREAGGAPFGTIRVIAESLAIAYALLLDTDGAIVGDPVLQEGRIGVVDLGHNTVDFAVLHRMAPVASGFHTLPLGTVTPLGALRARISGEYGRTLSLYETDQAVRTGVLRVAGAVTPVPVGWERPLQETGAAIAAAMAEQWRGGAELDAILIAGGGAELAVLTTEIQQRFPAATVVPEGQLAVARGYARLARRQARRTPAAGASR